MLKQKVVALCATVAMSSAVLADDLSIQPVSNAFDESKIFELAPNQSLNAVELSESQMKETEGEFWWQLGGGVIGGTGGAAGYLIECEISPHCDFETMELLKRMGSGAWRGAALGPLSVWEFNRQLGKGMFNGVRDYYK